MAKVTLTDLTSLANDTSAVNSINTNFQTLEDYINNNVLSRDTGGEVNTMQNGIDMNSNAITNASEITVGGISILAQVTAAAASAAAALTSENNAATSETNAAASAAAAAASAASVDVSLAQQNTWTAAQVASTQVNATATGNITLDFATYNNFVLTATGNVTLDNPTTETVGQSGFIVFKQDGTGSRTLTLGSQYLTAGAAGITISTAANSIDAIPYIVSGDGEVLLGSAQLAFA